MTLCIYGDYIVLLHWEIRLPAPSQSHYPDTEKQSVKLYFTAVRKVPWGWSGVFVVVYVLATYKMTPG